MAPLYFCLFAALLFLQGCSIDQSRSRTEKNLLLLVCRNYGVNYYLDNDRFDELGWRVTHAGVIDTIPPCPFYYARYGVTPLVPQMKAGDVDNLREYDAIVIVPSSNFASPIPFDEFLNSPEVLNLVRRANEQGLPIFTYCQGSRVLAKADIIRGRSVIGAPKFKNEIEAAGATFVEKNHPPVIDGNIVTAARDQYYNVQNVEAVAEVMERCSGAIGPKEHLADALFSVGRADMSDGNLVWARTLGTEAAEGAAAVCATTDGGCLVTGFTFAEGTGDADLLVIKAGSDGRPEWTRVLGGEGAEYGYGCTEVEGGYLVVGYTTSFGEGSKDVYAVKLDRDGNEIWTKTYGGPSWDIGRSAVETRDGYYLICGYTNSSGAGEEDIYLIKTDRDGKTAWSRTYGGERSELGYVVRERDDGRYLVAGVTGTFGHEGNTDSYLLCLDGDGNEQWSQTYGFEGPIGHGFDWCTSMDLAPDAGCVLSGYTDSEDIMNAFIVRTDRRGNEVWSVRYGQGEFYDFATDVKVQQDGSVVACGATKSVGTPDAPYDNNVGVVWFDRDGNKVREKVIGGPASDWPSGLLLTEDGEILLAGRTKSSYTENSTVLLMMLSEQEIESGGGYSGILTDAERPRMPLMAL